LNNSPGRTGRNDNSGGSTWQSNVGSDSATDRNPSRGGRTESPSQGYAYGGGRPAYSPAPAASEPAQTAPPSRVITIPAQPSRTSPNQVNRWSQPTLPTHRNNGRFNDDDSDNRYAPVRSTPRYLAPAQSAENFSPAPATRIERPTPVAPPSRGEYSAPPRSSPPATSGGGGRSSGRSESASGSQPSGDGNSRPGRSGGR
jgi:hypothetical protein